MIRDLPDVSRHPEKCSANRQIFILVSYLLQSAPRSRRGYTKMTIRAFAKAEMVAESFKMKLPQVHYFPDPVVVAKASPMRVHLWILLSVVLTASLILSSLAFVKTTELQKEVQLLRGAVKKLQEGFVEDFFIDMKKIENDKIYPDKKEDQTIYPIKNDDLEYKLNYGDDMVFQETVDKNSSEQQNDSNDQAIYPVDLELSYDDDMVLQETVDENSSEQQNDDDRSDDLKRGGSHTKIGKETRIKRDVIASTWEGVPINAESYADMKKKNKTRFGATARPDGSASVEAGYQSPSWPPFHSMKGLTHFDKNVRNPTPTPAPVLSRNSRVMHTENPSKTFRRVLKAPQLKSGGRTDVEEQIGGQEFVIYRDEAAVHKRNKHRNRHGNLETFEERPKSGKKLQPAIHFNGDTSNYKYGQHTNYNGDGHLQHPDQTFVDWLPSSWVNSLNMDDHFQMERGHLKIQEHGLYLVYVQIYYQDEHDVNAYRVYKNDDMVLQCTTAMHSGERLSKGSTCFTAGLEYFNEGDRLKIRDLHDGRYSIFLPGKSFFGVVKLGDVKIK